MEHHATVAFFSTRWFEGMLSLVVFIAVIFYIGKKYPQHRQTLKKAIGIALILRELLLHPYLNHLGIWNIQESLPLHMCAISRFVTLVLMFGFNQLLYEFLILLGMAGAFQSFLTPEMPHGDSSILLIVEYYLGHAVIIAMPLYFFFIEKRDIRKNSWLNAFLLGNLFLIIVGTINHFIGSNYIYLCQKPLVDNPLIIGEWPYYLIGIQVFGLIHIYLLYLLFRYLQKKRKKKTAAIA